MSPKKKASTKPKNNEEIVPTEENLPVPEPIQRPERNATEELMALTLTAWKLDVVKNLFYRINRTFCHYRLDEKYGTHIIFEQLEQLNHGRHEELLKSMDDFSKQVMKELGEYLADKESTK